MLNVLVITGVRQCRPAINRAFHAARTIMPPVASFSNDYIDMREFRVLLVYLCYYIELWELFSQIDTSDDRRVGLREFQQAIPLFEAWGLEDAASWSADPKAAFDAIDYDGKGMVLFDEFADFCLRNHVHRQINATVDPADQDEALQYLREKKPNTSANSLASMMG